MTEQKRLTCEEAGCRDPYCLAYHLRVTLSLPETCTACRGPFRENEQRICIAMRAPAGTAVENGTALATTALYHEECQPSKEELRAEKERLWPAPEPEPEPEMRQAMACLSCGMAGETPKDHFPQMPGLWDRPCPQCGENKVWVTEVRT